MGDVAHSTRAWITVTSRQRNRALAVALALLVCAWPVIEVGASGEVTLTGRIAIDHGDGFPAGASIEYTMLETDSQRIRLEGLPADDLPAGVRVRVTGKRRGDSLAVSSRSSSVVVVASGPQELASAGTVTSTSTSTDTTTVEKTVGVLLINFVEPTPSPTPTPVVTPSPTTSPAAPPTATTSPSPTGSPAPSATPGPDVTTSPSPSPIPTPSPTPSPSPTPTSTPPPEPWTTSAVRGVYFTNTRSVADYYADLSEGKMSVSGDVFGWYTLSISTSSCNYNAWGQAARDAATAAGVNLSAYTNLVYAFPRQQSCWWSGLANLPGGNSWINGSMSLFVTSHELGHNWGVHHASTVTCMAGGVRVQYSANCTADEYGDPFDIMGYRGQRHMSNWHRWQMGFLSTADIATATTHGVYRVATASTPGASPRILRVPRPSGDYYYLEFRQPYGKYEDFKSTAAVVNGVSVRIAPDLQRVQSLLLDANPATSSFSDAAVAVGQTLSDPINQIYLTTLSVDPSGASVLIQVGPDVVPPSAPTDLVAAATPDGSVHLAWSPASDDLIVSGYQVLRDGVAVATVVDPSYVDVGLTQDTTYAYTVEAFDRASNVGPASDPASVYLPDTTPPGAPVGASATITGPHSVEVTWLPASDNIGVVGYEVLRNGVPLATTAGETIVDDAAADGQTHTYEVRASDAAGNVGAAATAIAELPDATPPELAGELSASMSAGFSASDAVTLAWPAATDNVGVVGYDIERDGAWLATVTEPGFADPGLPQDRHYSYAVVARDAAGHRSSTLTATVFVPDTIAPQPPAGLSATLAAAREVDLAWLPAVDNVAVDHYRVLHDGALVATPATTTLSGIAVSDGRVHRFTVEAVDTTGNVGAAAVVELSVPDVSPPSAPVLSAIANGSTAVSLAWTPATDNVGVSSQVIYRNGVAIAQLGPSTTSYLDSDLPSDQTHTYQVVAFDAAGNAGTSLPASVALVSVDVTPPSAPADLVGKALNRRRVSLTWTASTDDRAGTIRYQVFRRKRKIAVVTDTAYVDRPTLGTYRYRVRAVDSARNKSVFSNSVWVTAVRRV